MIHHRWRRYVPILAALLVIAISGIILTNGSGVVTAQSVEPWPAFVMTYRVTAPGFGLNGAVGTQRFRLEYTDRRHFRTTLIEDAALPGAVGSTWAFDGTASTFHDTRHGADQVAPYTSSQATVPADWIVPGRVQALTARPGYSALPTANGLAVLIHDDRASGHAFHSELTYRQTDGIPTRLTETVDGQVKRTAEVEQLQLTPR